MIRSALGLTVRGIFVARVGAVWEVRRQDIGDTPGIVVVATVDSEQEAERVARQVISETRIDGKTVMSRPSSGRIVVVGRNDGGRIMRKSLAS